MKTIPGVPKSVLSRKSLDIRSGDAVRVHIKIVEADGKTRSQMFEGLVLARKHGAEAGATITVRKISHGVGVERIFPIYSPMIEKIEVVRRSTTRRSKLYYVRDRVARDIRHKMRNLVEYIAPSDTVLADATDVPEQNIETQPEDTKA